MLLDGVEEGAFFLDGRTESPDRCRFRDCEEFRSAIDVTGCAASGAAIFFGGGLINSTELSPSSFSLSPHKSIISVFGGSSLDCTAGIIADDDDDGAFSDDCCSVELIAAATLDLVGEATTDALCSRRQ